MTVCPFCKGPVSSSNVPCPRCGRRAADHPSIAAMGGRNLATDFDDDDDGVPDLAHGSSVGGHAHEHVSSYEASNTTFDSDLMDDDAPMGGALELDMPPMPNPPAAPDLAPPPPSVSRMQAAQAEPTLEPLAAPLPAAPAPAPPAAESKPAVSAKPDPATIIARYPDPPEPNKIWLMPIYACKVLYRQFELRMDLTSLRRRRSPDVPLYERALEVYEPRSFFIGLAITGAVLSLATFVFFLPVILRFARAPD